MTAPIPLVVHMTHEAGIKVGGIGAVLDGLLGALAYNVRIERTIVAGPLHGADSVEMERLTDPANGVVLRYSSVHGVYNGVTSSVQAALAAVERRYGVALLYGTRRFGNAVHEILLVDAGNPSRGEIDAFHYLLWDNYKLDCLRYSGSQEFVQALAVAPPLLAALHAIDAGAGLKASQKVIVAHEWMGLPLVFAAQIYAPGQWCTVYYAHEVPTARRLIEGRSGHDTAFYNVLFKSKTWQLDIDSLYGNQDDSFKHRLVRLASRCDNVLAVGDLTVDELRFMGGRLGRTNISLVYNGLPSQTVTLEEKLDSKRLLQLYAQNLLGFTPDFVFTHVGRLVLSKAFWRDMRVLDHLDTQLRRTGEHAVMFVLATSLPAGRRPDWVHAWEEQYGWPVAHRADNGDLVDAEVDYFANVLEPFNRQATNIRAVLVNQFGWNQARCGKRMPAAMTFTDIRRGADLEFGQSIYEPFGIAQMEPLTYGALSCVSNVCGCVSFVDSVMGGSENLPNLVVADYMSLPQGYWLGSPYDALAIDQGVRDWVETNSSRSAAQTIHERLPRTDDGRAQMIASGATAAARMSWEIVVQDYFLPALKYATRKGE